MSVGMSWGTKDKVAYYERDFLFELLRGDVEMTLCANERSQYQRVPDEDLRWVGLATVDMEERGIIALGGRDCDADGFRMSLATMQPARAYHLIDRPLALRTISLCNLQLSTGFLPLCDRVFGDKSKPRDYQYIKPTDEYREWCLLFGRRWFLMSFLGKRGGGCDTVDDVRSRLKIPIDVSPYFMTGVPTLMKDLGIIATDGRTGAKRRESHSGPRFLWRLIDRSAALAWLRDNPEPLGTAPCPYPQEKKRC